MNPTKQRGSGVNNIKAIMTQKKIEKIQRIKLKSAMRVLEENGELKLNFGINETIGNNDEKGARESCT